MSNSSTKRGLGRGFDALMPADFDASLLLDSNDRIQKLTINSISPNPGQPRRHFDEAALDELAVSIKNFGVLQPIIVTPVSEGNYRIMAGERRWRASSRAGLTQIPAIVREPKEQEELEVSLIENVQRVDLSPIEQAVSIERLHQQFNMTYSAIAERMGKAVPTINNLVRLLQLPTAARKALEQSKISEGHARAILALKGNESNQQALLDLIISEGWSVRQAEQYAIGHRENKQKRGAKARVANETPATKRLGIALGRTVTLKRTAHGGRLEIHFKDDTDLDNLIDQLR